MVYNLYDCKASVRICREGQRLFMDNKQSEFQQWIADQLGTTEFSFAPLQGDASFRSYYRVATPTKRFIVMLAPPATERTDQFVTIARIWKAHDLPVPEIWGWEPTQGFVLLSDFGDTLLSHVLNETSVDMLYQSAMQLLLKIPKTATEGFYPAFDEAHIRLECSYFQEWFLDKLLGLEITPAVQDLLEQVFAQLVSDLREQPQVVIHRDYHSRNLMLLDQNNALGVIDFQDAMIGPFTYDLVSLLKDCYVAWPLPQVHFWAQSFLQKLHQEKRYLYIDTPQFLKWFDTTGLQRHIKVLGIFSRLKLRDNKPHYLQDIPRVMQYVLEVTHHAPEYKAFDHFLRNTVLPRMKTLWQSEALHSNTQVA